MPTATFPEICNGLLFRMLKCWAKFSNVLIHSGIRMFRAKNYETVFKFVKVMRCIEYYWLLFSGHGVYIIWPVQMIQKPKLFVRLASYCVKKYACKSSQNTESDRRMKNSYYFH